MVSDLYNTWLENINSNFEDQFTDPIIKRYCYWHGGNSEGVDVRGKVFNAAYEIYIYAFFLGLYSGEGRRPLIGKKRNFSMEMKRWGNINLNLFPNRKTYPIIQKYVFAALIAKTDVDLIALDRGDKKIEEVVSDLMTTLSEYANTGFYLIKEKMEAIPDFFDAQQSFLNFLLKYSRRKNS